MTKSKLCTNCGFVGYSKRITKGSFIMEVVLWMLFLVPGIFYTVWRVASRYEACPKCAAGNMIPTDSPVALKMVQEQRRPQPIQYNQTRGVPPPPGGEVFFRIAIKGQDFGDISVTTIKQMIAAGQLGMHDYFFDVEANDWLQLECLAALD